jgi:hypothetical protein
VTSQACPACSCASTRCWQTLRDHETREDFELSRCDECGFAFLTNPPGLEAIGRYYQNTTGQRMMKAPSALFLKLQRFLLGMDVEPLLKRLDSGEKVADFGAGDGALCRYLASREVDVTGVDFHDGTAWMQPGIPFKSLDLNALSSNEGLSLGVDAVIFRHALEHLHQPKAVLRSLGASNVKHVLVIVPNLDSWGRRLLGRSWYYWDPPRHLSHFNPSSLRALAEGTGYRVASMKTYGIDELCSSIHRGLLLRNPKSRLARIFSPKSPLAGLSSALSYPLNSVLWALLERDESRSKAKTHAA